MWILTMYYRTLDEWGPKLETARQWLGDLKAASHEAWHELKASLGRAWGELKKGLEGAASKFR